MADMQDMLGMGMDEGIETNVDIVFVIDATRSMEKMIETVKNATLTFQDELYEALKENIQWILTGAVALVIGLWAFVKFIWPRISKKERRA